jgi:hypothetical protein
VHAYIIDTGIRFSHKDFGGRATSGFDAIKPAVANMSLGGGANTALDSSVGNTIKAGVSYAVAEGNENACDSSPGRVDAAITGVVTGAGTGSPNRLLNVKNATATPPPPPPASPGTTVVSDTNGSRLIEGVRRFG